MSMPTQPASPDPASGDAGTSSPDTSAADAPGHNTRPPARRRRRGRNSPSQSLQAAWFVLPALILLAGLVLYPIIFSIVRSLFDANGAFAGGANYVEMFTDPETLTAVRNNIIWVVVAPSVVTAFGLVFAVLTERIRWSSAFKAVVFMPMAISFLASGVIFRLVYDQNPDKGLANAIVVSVHDLFAKSSQYPGARPSEPKQLVHADGGYHTATAAKAGTVVALPLVAVSPTDLPKDAAQAATATGSGLRGTVWLDFKPGGGGKSGVIDKGEKGLPGVKVEAMQGGHVVASTETAADGTFSFPSLSSGAYTVDLPSSNFRQPFDGITRLSSTLVSPSIIAAYIWIYAGFAMVLVASGLSTIPRDTLEAARIDGANEWKVFRYITMPLLAPVLVVIMVTLVINVLKVFDLVYIMAPGSVQDSANVLALQMWKVSFGGGNNQGLGSAIGVFLFALVLPAMIINIRRFRREQQ